MRARVWVFALAVSIAGTASADGRKENVVTGDGQGYSAEVVAADIGGALAVPLIALPTWKSSNPWIWTIPLSGVPATLSGPIVHAIHGRWVPAVASFFGWASVVATGWFTGAVLQMGTSCNVTDRGGSPPCTPMGDRTELAVGAGIGAGVLGAALMTVLDAWMARTVKPERVLEPSAWVTTSGGGAGLGGTF